MPTKKSQKSLEEQYPGNSQMSKVVPIRPEPKEEGSEETPQRRPRPIAKGRAIRKKTSLAQRVAASFIGDTSHSVGQYIVYDVLIPALKSTIQDMITSGLDMILYNGEGGGPSRRRSSRDRDRTSFNYGSIYKRDSDRREPHERRATSRNFGLDEIYFKDHNDAEDVLDGLCELLEQYQEVTVADYYELAGIEGANWIHNKWGWENLSKGYCTHTRHGYAIVLPDPKELD